MADVQSVELIGEGGSTMTFDLPLSEPFAKQVQRGKLKPASDEDAAILDGEDLDASIDAPEDDLLDGNVGDILEIVGEDAELAAEVLSAEREADKPRKGLVSALEKIVG